jgi:arginine decarboxylase
MHPTAADDQSRTPYADAVAAYANSDFLRFDVPGHQAASTGALAEYFGQRLLALDVPPLIENIDQGQAPTPLAQSADLAARAWGARKTYLLTNGASKGNLVTCIALRALGDVIVVQRSVHSSVIDGIALAGLDVAFVQPVVDLDLGIAHGVTTEQLREALARSPHASAAYIVSPSYFGAVADVEGLARVAHDAGVPLVVDEAWGAHFGFHPAIPTNALRFGADVVISSTHKLGGSLTQSAMLHLGEGKFASRLEPALDRAFRSLQSTSSSALLTASLDLARRDLVIGGPARLQPSIDAAAEIRAGITEGGRHTDATTIIARAEGVISVDPLRVVVDTRRAGLTGHEARARLFRDHKVHVEMATNAVIVAVIGAGATPDVGRFLDALHALPDLGQGLGAAPGLPEPGRAAMTVREAYFATTEVLEVHAAVGRVSADTLSAYPPGIPNLVAGEIVTAEVVNFLQATARAPFGYVRGGISQEVSHLRVVIPQA